MEGPERVLGACSGAKEAHREVPIEPIKFFLGSPSRSMVAGEVHGASAENSTGSYGLLRCSLGAPTVGSAECGGPGGGGGGYASRGRRNRLLPKDAQYPLGTADLKG